MKCEYFVVLCLNYYNKLLFYHILRCVIATFITNLNVSVYRCLLEIDDFICYFIYIKLIKNIIIIIITM